jgi:predicted patatin/cPLA2 family phospholipase
MWQVARSTSAAPTFFQPVNILESYFVDGGLWANNPSLVGIIEAMKSGFKLEEISILSLGTGATAFQVDQNKAKKMNLKNWGFNGLIELSFQSQSQAVENQIAGLLKDNRYFRAQHQFQSNISLDGVSRLGDLEAAAHNLYRENGAQIIGRFFKSLSTNPYKSS